MVENYTGILSSPEFRRPLWNSTFIAGASTALVVAVAAMAAYVFTRFAFRGRELLATMFAIGLMFPFAVAILPLYVLPRELDLLDNPLGVVLPQAAFFTQFHGQYGVDTARVLAYVSLAMVPALAFYAVAERQLVGGLAFGAVKG